MKNFKVILDYQLFFDYERGFQGSWLYLFNDIVYYENFALVFTGI